MGHPLIERVDAEVSIYDVAARYGLGWQDIGRDQQVHCPMHADDNPSARLYVKSNSGYCWTCQRAFGPSRLAAEREGVTVPRAAEMLADLFGVDPTVPADFEEARRLAALWSSQRGARPGDPRETRRAASMALRAAGRPWAESERLLRHYEALDLTDIDPRAWLEAAPAMLSPTQGED